jgi:hypothetical protein
MRSTVEPIGTPYTVTDAPFNDQDPRLACVDVDVFPVVPALFVQVYFELPENEPVGIVFAAIVLLIHSGVEPVLIAVASTAVMVVMAVSAVTARSESVPVAKGVPCSPAVAGVVSRNDNPPE